MPLRDKYRRLVASIRSRGPSAVAYSGGVDSTLLLRAAKDALHDGMIALTADLPYMARGELHKAKVTARSLSARHRTVEIPFPESIRFNPEERCYLCKKHLFTILIGEAARAGCPVILEGTNADDLDDVRPGIRALRELGVVSPLLETGFTKEDIRAVSKTLELPTWHTPAGSCLLTRLPHGREVTGEELERIEKSEDHLFDLGFRAVRVRSHGDIARIEFARGDRKKVFNEILMDAISRHLKFLGYRHVTMELEGYTRGGMSATDDAVPREKRD